MKSALATLVLIGMLPACSAFQTPSTTRPLYLLQANAAPAPATTATAPATTLTVRPFTVTDAYAGFDFIWFKDGAYQRDAYHGWIARPGEMMADASVNWLAASSACFSRVQREDISLPTTRSLQATVTRFDANLDATPPVATIAIRFYLSGQDMTPLVVDTMAAEPIAKPDADRAVQAWNAGLTKCLQTFVQAVRAQPVKSAAATPAPAAVK